MGIAALHPSYVLWVGRRQNSIGDARDGYNHPTKGLSLVDRSGDIRRRVQSVMRSLDAIPGLLPYQLDSDSLILIAGSLAPLLVLFALRRVLLVVLIYVSTLFWILVQQVLDLQHGCLGVAKPFQKYSNEPAAILSFFGAFSIYVFLAWGAIRLVVLVWRKFDRAEP
jgi:hypothetical protein